MGCGHSKINIYPKKRTRNKQANNKKTVTPEKQANGSGGDDAPNDHLLPASVKQQTLGALTQKGAGVGSHQLLEDDADEDGGLDRKLVKVRPVVPGGGNVGGPLVAHMELSTSQNNFFKMLDEKIESGPDYDSTSEYERHSEKQRRAALLKDWETASVNSSNSRSLPSTPARRSHKAPQPHDPSGGVKARAVYEEKQRAAAAAVAAAKYRNEYDAMQHYEEQQMQQRNYVQQSFGVLQPAIPYYNTAATAYGGYQTTHELVRQQQQQHHQQQQQSQPRQCYSPKFRVATLDGNMQCYPQPTYSSFKQQRVVPEQPDNCHHPAMLKTTTDNHSYREYHRVGIDQTPSVNYQTTVTIPILPTPNCALNVKSTASDSYRRQHEYT